MRDTRTLVLFTTAFPFGKGEQFLETELPYLVSRFRQVLVVPTQVKGPMRPLPADIIERTIYLVSMIGIRTFRRIRPSISVSLILARTPDVPMPALLTRP